MTGGCFWSDIDLVDCAEVEELTQEESFDGGLEDENGVRVGRGGELLETGAEALPERLQVELLTQTRQNAGEKFVEFCRRR